MADEAWIFPPADTADEHGIVGVGADLKPKTIISAYTQGLFPMPLKRNGPIGWWSPDPRAVIPLDGLHISRTLRRSMKRFHFTVNTAFSDVIDACADESRPHGWIDSQVRHGYTELHRLGWAHSIETRNDDGELVGGVYGVGIRGLFAGESMFHTETDASKAALVHTVELLQNFGAQLFDVQWLTPHLSTLGAIDLSRTDYLRRLERALEVHDKAGFVPSTRSAFSEGTP